MPKELARMECVPCKGGVPPVKGSELAELEGRLGSSWRTVDQHHLEKEFTFKDFREALVFTNEVGELANPRGTTPTSI